MESQISKNHKASIIYLFEKMDSNVSKYRDSIHSSPTAPKTLRNNHSHHEPSDCSCTKDNQGRKNQNQFYSSQQELVSKAASLLKVEGNDTLSRLLTFMSQFLQKICEQLKKPLLCECKNRKIMQNEDLHHKINFLREQNHKFFRMVEDKTWQCDRLNTQIQTYVQQLSQKIRTQQQTPIGTHFKSHMAMASVLTQEISSRAISSNSSRVSEFRHAWPQMTIPMGQFGHRRYFEAPPGDRQAHFKQGLFERDTNSQFQNTFRKTKIFQNNLFIQ